jgi:signal transduction histidine kinase
MKKLIATIIGVSFLVLMAESISFAAEFGTAPEAEALVKKAIQLIKAEGRDKAFAEINNPKGKFIDRDLYIFVYDMNGKCVAHGFNPKMIGKELFEMKDTDGKYFVKERIEIAKTKGHGWQDYKFTNPITKHIEPKSAYVERVENLIVGCGVYKR